MEHVATTTSVTTTRVRTATSAFRWLGILLAALLLLQVGVWLGRNSASSMDCSASTQHRPPIPRQHAIATNRRRRATNASTSSASAALNRRQLVQNACRNAIVPLNPSCPRQLVVKYLESAGFGHQLTEMLFGMYAARYLGLTLTWSAIASSGDHGDDYTGLVERLGLEWMFVDGLGLARADDLRELRRRRETSQPNLLFGDWIEAGNMDKRGIAPLACNNSVLTIEGWWHCRGVADNNCFWAPEHEFLFQRFGRCLRAGVGAYGKVFSNQRRCFLLESGNGGNDDDASASPHDLPRDTVVVVWHLRFGDVALVHKPGDAFFTNVIEALKEITGYSKGLVKRVRIVLVGGGKGTAGVPDFYEDSLRGLAVVGADGTGADVASTNNDELVEFQVERLNASSFDDQFIAMMQADVLIGSGSSVPQVAALLSPGRPLFFNHVPKHGYGYGQEATADAVDMDEQGRALDSLRRVRLMLFERMDGGGGEDDDDVHEQVRGGGCRRRRRQGAGR